MTRTFTCHCQEVVTAENTPSLVAPVKAHFDLVHAEFGLTLANIRNYLESEDRSTGPSERLAEIGNIDIRPMTAESGPDAIRFFDIDAFPDNPAWGACYCMFFARGGRANANWGEEPWQENRADQLDRIGDAKTTGMLAYAGEKVVGWCNAGARDGYPGLATGDDDGIASVVCFAIAPPYRGHGVATRLLDAVVEGYHDRGFIRLEAHPVREADNERHAFHGTLDLYLKAGFETVSEDPLVVGMDLR